MPQTTQRASPQERPANVIDPAKGSDALTVARVADNRGTALDRVVEALERHGQRVDGHGQQRNAQCPVHDDHRPSLSIKYVGGCILLNCHRECDRGEIVATLGLTWPDLFDTPRERDPGEWTPWRDRCRCIPVAWYPYTDKHGELLYQHVRGEHKEFAFRRPDSSSRSGWKWNLDGVRRVLYRLPELLAMPADGAVFLTEGEKDADALRAAGEVATCTDSGALTGQGGKSWRSEWTEALAGREVLIVADRDRAGREHAWIVYNAIKDATRFAWIVQAAEGKDAADHLAAGQSVTDFVWWSL
jgi:5S rRNA maturation endonuclease (ribonuclease M5)